MGNIEREKISNKDVVDEKKILIGLITNKKLVQSIRNQITPQFFEANYSQLIAKWCLDYWDKIKDVPYTNIKDIYEKESMGLDKIDAELIDSLLINISEMHLEEQHSEKYIYEIFKDLKKKKDLKELLDEATLYYRADDIEGAIRALKKRKKIQKESNNGFDFFDEKEIVKAFIEDEGSKIELFDGVQKVFFKYFKLGWLVSLIAPEKAGKSFTLEEFSFASFEAGYNTTVVSLELGENELKKRYYQRIALKSEERELNVSVPIMDCKQNQHNTCQSKKRKNKIPCYDPVGNKIKPELLPNYKPCTACRIKDYSDPYWRNKVTDFQPAIWSYRTDIEKMEISDAVKAAKKYKKIFNGKLRGKCFPAFSATLTEVEDYLDYLEEIENFFTEVLVIDYPDILSYDDSKEKGRDRIDDVWKRLKQLAQTKNILIFVVEQSNKIANHKISQDASDVSEDKRKNGHINAKYAINVTKEEHKDGVIRIAPLLHRHLRINKEEHLLCLRLLEISQPMIDCELVEIKETEVQKHTYSK